ncbi:uncharacterized protein Orcokinin isoform X2 [Drosophila pseudoobscura]|uniref:Uncharacterized protein Orcokinin isoform X2 n=1 Tax=Drosophila pseudoobscura pseudoobscura TaxID=46245 RepID=A0A6I8VEK7_DROPS|nr:uncharacterized protein LOC4803527 isoform X2 [Drosophila pseudoobscura]
MKFRRTRSLIDNMNLLVVLLVVTTVLNFIRAAPSVDLSNDELMDGKYLCEDRSTSKQFGNGNGENFRPISLISDDISTNSPFINEFYNSFLRSILLTKNKNIETLSDRMSRAMSKRNLDSIGGGHLIKRSDSSRLLSA